MFVDPDKPLPLDEEKKDGLGAVLNAIIAIANVKSEIDGTTEEFEAAIEVQQVEATKKITEFSDEVEKALLDHTEKRGAVHGETKTTVGLENKNNWRPATLVEHEAGEIKDAYAVPSGIKALVQKRLKITPENYIRSRIIPVASGGQLGNIPQYPFNWQEGEVIESVADAMKFYSDTPWQFQSDQGVQIYPAMNGSDILTQHIADPGRSKRASTPFGGAMIRIYKSVVDIRRTRPSFIKGESNLEPNNELVKASDHLFDRHSISYMDGNLVGVRAFNKNRLPFDTMTNGGSTQTQWSGILESRENILYNIYTHVEKGNIGGFGEGIYLVIETDLWGINGGSLDSMNGPGRPAETVATLGDKVNTITYSLPANNKYRLLNRPGKPQALCVKLSDLVSFTIPQMESIWESFDEEKATRMAFTWRSRLRGDYAIRVPLGFFSLDRKTFTNYYLDTGFIVREDMAAKTATVTVTSLRNIDSVTQTLTANLTVDKPGRFIAYGGNVANDVFNPQIFNGIFDGNGGHIKTYTFYNRQYVGYYQHNVKSVLNWIANGDNVQPIMTKYIYNQMSTLNNDGMYGDHLRHIPISVNAGVTDYLTLTRDWNQAYRWGITKIKTDTAPELFTPTGRHMGPWRIGTTWIAPKENKVPSFLIVNSEESAAFDVNCMVFNTQSNFTGYARFGVDVGNLQEPLQWLDEVVIDDVILTAITKVGNWPTNHKQMFYYRGKLYYFTQCIKAEDIPDTGIDCYYGWIGNVYIDTDALTGKKTVRVNGSVNTEIVSKPLKVNTKESLSIEHNTIFGFDRFESTDIYMMLMNRTGAQQQYKLMVNLAPFNNFYFEFDLSIDDQTLSTNIVPTANPMDPVFPYDQEFGYNVNYNAITAYGSKTPHRFHVNFQTPVMLKKSMWSFRKTPGSYGIFAQSIGTVVAIGGMMNSIPGVPIYPVGSVATVSGTNVIVKSPVSAEESAYGGNDELYVRLIGTAGASGTASTTALYGLNHNPARYETEPNSGAVPCGFLKNSIFYHYDPDGWRNDLLPVIDGKRMNFYGYGSSFPAFGGKFGSGTPVNRFFLVDDPSIISWNTATGRNIVVGTGSNIKIFVNNVQQTYNGTGTFQIPGTFTGTVVVKITGAIKLTWSPGFTTLTTIGNTVTQLDFANSTQFTISAQLPKRIGSLANLFKGATGASYPGLETWDTSAITDMSGCFSGAVNFNQNLTNWNTSSVTTMAGMFTGASKFNTVIGSWNMSNVTTVQNMFKLAIAFNQDLSTWKVEKVSNFSGMFSGASQFNGNISTWDIKGAIDLSSMFEEAINFNGNILSWDVSGAVNMNKMFKRASKFNSQLNSWDVGNVINMGEMFSEALAFSRNIDSWNTTKVTNMFEMFFKTVLFGADSTFELSTWNMSNVTDATRMFGYSNFNCKVDNWVFGSNSIIHEMFLWNPKFNQDVSSWDVRNVFDMAGIFRSTTAFNKDIVGWNIQSCVAMSHLFNSAAFSGDLIGWVINPNPHPTLKINMTSVFRGAINFNGAGIKTWDVSGVTAMPTMFYDARSFNQDLSGWDVSKVSNWVDFGTGATSWVLPKPNFTL